MTSPLPWPSPAAENAGQVMSADWLRLARLARLLSWLTLAWMGIEGGLAIWAAVVAGSVALLGFGLDSGIEAMASIIVIWRFTGTRLASPTSERRAQQLVAVSFFLLAPYIAVEAIRGSGDRGAGRDQHHRPGPHCGNSHLRARARAGETSDRRPARLIGDRRGGDPESTLRLSCDRGVRRAGRQHAVGRLVARRRGRARHRWLGSSRGTTGVGREIVWLRMSARCIVLIIQAWPSS